MIHIEKIRTEIHPYQHTLVDIFLGKTPNKAGFIHNAEHLADTLFAQLNDYIRIGEKFGINGVSIGEAIAHTGDDVIFELDMISIMTLSRIKLKKLLSSKTIILSDYNDGGLGIFDLSTKGYSRSLPKFLMETGIIPRKIYYATGSYNFGVKIDSLNITSIVIPLWLTVSVINNLYKNTILTNERNQYLNIIKTENYVSTAMCLNMKPRADRLALLALLYEKSLLDYIDWSLVHVSSKEQLFHIYKNSIVKTSIARFSQAYDFPRIIFSDESNRMLIGGLPRFADIPAGLIKKYKWHINTETWFGMNIGLNKRAQYGHVTEKTGKAFFCGSMPLTLATTGYKPYLESLGFIMPDTGIEQHNDPIQKTVALVDHIQHVIENNITPDPDHILHNAELITDKEFLCSLVSKPLIDAFYNDK